MALALRHRRCQLRSLIEMAEQWEGIGNWDAAQWLVHWVESVDIGSGFDAANPLPTFAPGAGPCDGPPAADSGHGSHQAAASAASSSAQPPPGLGARFGDEYPHFPNGHRRLGLSPQVLVECHSWIVDARDSHNYLGFTSGDWLVHWFAQDSREEVRRLVQCASEANQGWSAASWLKLWLEEADIPGPPPARPWLLPRLALDLALPLVLALALPLAPRTLPSSQPAVLAQASNPPGTPNQINECINRATDLLQISLQFMPVRTLRALLAEGGLSAHAPMQQLLPALEAWRSLVTGFGPSLGTVQSFSLALPSSFGFLWLCTGLDRHMRLCPWNGRPWPLYI